MQDIFQSQSIHSVAKGEQNVNTLVEGAPWIGIATWNVNHYGEGADFEIVDRYRELKSSVEKFRAVEHPWNLYAKRVNAENRESEKQKLRRDLEEYRKQLAQINSKEMKKTVKEDDSLELSYESQEAFNSCLSRLSSSFERLTALATICNVQSVKAEAEKSTVHRSSERIEKSRPYFLAAQKFHQAFNDAKEKLADVRKEIKQRALPFCIRRLFEMNPWLDVLVLQEVNSYDSLKKRMERELNKKGCRLQLELHPGPRMLSSGGSQHAQHEFYPIVLRTGGKVAYKGSFFHQGNQEVRDQKEVVWDKKSAAPDFRPVIFHKLEVSRGEKTPIEVNVGVVHTTPGQVKGHPKDREFYRSSEYEQLENDFEQADKKSQTGVWWILAGDYYLSSEAIVERNPTSLTVEDMRESLRKHHETELAKLSSKNLLNELIRQEKSDPKIEIVEREGIDAVRNILDLTFKARLPESLRIACAVSGTNWHGIDELWSLEKREKKKEEGRKEGKEEEGKKAEKKEANKDDADAKARFYAMARVADFFVHSKVLENGCAVGIFHPLGKIVPADSEDNLSCSRFWCMLSDHFPVGGVFSPRSLPAIDKIVELDFEEGEKAAWWSSCYRLAYRFALLKKRLDDQKSNAILDRALKEEKELRDWLTELEELIDLPKDFKPFSKTSEKLPRKDGFYLYKKQRKENGRGEVLVWNDEHWWGTKLFRIGDDNDCWSDLKRLIHSLESEMIKTEILGEDQRWGEEELKDLQPMDYGWETKSTVEDWIVKWAESWEDESKEGQEKAEIEETDRKTKKKEEAKQRKGDQKKQKTKKQKQESKDTGTSRNKRKAESTGRQESKEQKQ